MTKLKFLLSLTILLLYFSCSKKENKTFYKVTRSNLSNYFENPIDTVQLGHIIDLQLLKQNSFENDTMLKLLIDSDVCDTIKHDITSVCNPILHTILKINDKYSTYDSTIATHNSKINYLQKDSFACVTARIKQYYMYEDEYTYDRGSIGGELLGYYIDKFGFKEMVLYKPYLLCRNSPQKKNAILIYRWNNFEYVKDSIIALNGQLISLEKYKSYHKKYIMKCDNF